MVAILTYLENSKYSIMLLNAVVTLIIALIIFLITRRYFKEILKKIKESDSIEEIRIKRTRAEFLRTIISFLIFAIAVIYILFLIPGFKAVSVSLLAGAGIAAIIIGFAAQKTLANIIGGISIVVSTPFRIGDKIKIDAEMGDVEDITLRHTVIRTWDNKRLIIPNSLIAEKEIINYSIKDERLIWTVDIGISYDSNIEKAKKIMLKLANNHPDVICPEITDEVGNTEKKVPTARVIGLGDFAVNLRLSFWVEKPGNAWSTGYDLTEQIKKEFDKNNIEIPFPYHTIVYKKDIEKDKKKKRK